MRNLKVFSILLGLLLLLAACGGSSVQPINSTPTPGVKEIVLEGPNELKFVPDSANAKVGQEVKITLKNTGALEHNLVWDDTGEEVIVTQAAEEGTTSRTFDTAGEYGFHCSVPGHKEAGMIGKLIVE